MKSLTLFKRNSKGVINPGEPGYKDAPFYFRFNHRTVPYLKCTKSNVAEEALKIARRIYQQTVEDAIKGVVASQPAPAPLALATVDQFIEAYMVAPTEACEGSRRQNVSSLLQVLRVANPDCANIGALTIDHINAEAAEKWFAKANQANSQQADQGQQRNNKNSANSNFAKAVSIMHESLLDYYRDRNLSCPSMLEFRSKGKARRFKKLGGSNHYNPPAQAVIDGTMDAWLKLEDRNVFIAAGFALAFGLRKGEILQIKWGYLQQLHGGCPGLLGPAKVKNGSGSIEGRALDPYFTQMMARIDAKGWRGKDEELILQGGAAELKCLAWERLSQWLIGLGWNTQKKAHALRAYSGSKVYQRYGLLAAKLYLHHAKADMTERHYSHFASKWPMGDEERVAMPERWAARIATNILPMAMPAAA
jgi:hypothetical protein